MLAQMSLLSGTKNGGHIHLSPNNKIKFFLTTLYGRAEELKKLLIKVKVKYKNLEGKLYKHEYILDFSELLDIRRSGEPSIKKIANNLEKIQRDINKLLFSSFHKIKVIRYTKEDIENEQREILEEKRKFEEKQQKKKTK